MTPENINYKILVETGQSGIDANVILCIFGDEETTTNLSLRTTNDGLDAKFEPDSILEFNLQAVDVGKIKKINIGHDGKGSEQQWFLKTVQIEKKDELFIFKANRWLSEEQDDQKTFIDLFPDGQKTPPSSPVLKKDQSIYLITIVTSSDENAGTDSGVLMTIFGDKDITKQFQVINTKQGEPAVFETGKINEFEMELDDVGNINKINIGQDGTGSHPNWHLESIEIQKGSENYHFLANQTLDQSTSFIDLTPTPPRKTPTPEPTKLKSPSPEPTRLKTPSPELITRKSPSPEPTKLKSPSPEPTRLKTPTPELTTRKSPSPEPTKLKAPSPEPIKQKAPTPQPVKVEIPRLITPEPKHPPIKEAIYKVSIQSDSYDKNASNIYLIIHGQNNQTKKLVLNDSVTSNKKTECQFQTNDVGKISKIILGQENIDKKISWHVNNLTIKRNNETTTFNVEQIIQPDSEIELFPSIIPKKLETTYKIIVQTGTLQQEGDHSNLTITIFGQNGQTKKLPLDETTKVNKKNSFKKNEKIEFELKTHDVGKLFKIILHQKSISQEILWHINNIIIKRNNEITTFNMGRQLDENSEVELIPSPIQKKSETPRKSIKPSETIPKISIKTKDADYEIIISTGDRSIDAPILLKIHGDNGNINIPLTKSKTNEKPFQVKSTDEFTCRTADVGKIKRITFEYQGTDENIIWHIKTVQIKKGDEIYNFNANVRLDYKEKKVNIYPIGSFLGHQREDYVQTELRRLRENLRTESAKLHPPTHKAHEPFVYNDLSPYFDTSPVERAIYSPNDAPAGYYTRVTALHVVEPWKAYAMDYGVSYELLKQRKHRSASAKRSNAKSANESIDRKQGSTHLPKFPCVNMQKPSEYSRPLTMDDVPKIRSFIRTRYTTQAQNQIEQDYKRTHDDFYRMQLDNLGGYHESNRDNMVRIYHSYLENTPGSKKAVRELCDQVAVNNTKASVKTTV